MSELREDDIEMTRMTRSIRFPSQGNPMSSTTGHISVENRTIDTTIDIDGKVRRKWQPGDPWSDDYFFGGGDS